VEQEEFDQLIMSSTELHKLLTEMNGSYARALALLSGTIAETAIEPKAMRLHLQEALAAAMTITDDPLLPDLLGPSIEMLRRKQKTNEEQTEKPSH